MANKTAILAVRIITDASGAQKGFDQTATSAQKFQGTLDKLTPAALGVTAAIAGLATVALNAASDLQQATGAVESVFGAYADEVKGFADDAARNVGLAESEYSQLAAVLGSQLKNMGTPMEAVAGQTDELISLGADLAATFGGTTADAVSALSSLLRGERDPIERYGVSIKQADINAQKASMGLTGLTGEADKAADAQATLALLYGQTADASGQFARETDTLAGSQQIATASWKDAAAALGQSLLPVMATFAQYAADLAGWIEENATLVTILVGVLGGLAATILIVQGALAAYRAITVIATAAQWLWNVALAANPIGLIIIAIGLLIAIIVLLITHWDEVKAVAADVWGSVINWIRQVGDWFGDVFASIGAWWDDLIESFRHGFDQLFGWVNDALGWLGNLIGLGSQATSVTNNARATNAPLGWWANPASPSLMAAGTSPSLAAVAPLGSPTAPGGYTGAPIQITVDGALDPDAVGRQIYAILKKYGGRVGFGPASGRRV